ncbi:WXG100 family type VII secretion target [Amycolatopsis sp. NPDC059090]|uniref:WXG100 family type VII secretion target n=1 Tax=unclassified Amycolatopsis TaxID=2618356 RepID=UPI00367066C7
MKFWEPIKQYLDQHQELTVPIEDIVKEVHASDPSGWHTGATSAHEVASELEAISQDMSGTLTKLESSWTGQGADLVAERLRRVRASAIDAHQAFAANENTHATGIAMHENLRNQLTTIPPAPTGSPTPAAGLMNADVMSKMLEHDSAQQKNLDTYEKFTAESQGNTQQLKVDYGKIGTYDGGDVTIQQHPSAEAKPQPGPVAPEQHSTGGPGSTFTPSTGSSPHSSSAANTRSGGETDHTSTSGYAPPPPSGPTVDTPWRGETRGPSTPGPANEFGIAPISNPGGERLGGISERLGGGSGRIGSGSGRIGNDLGKLGGPGRPGSEGGSGRPGGNSGRPGGEPGPRSGVGASEGAASRLSAERGTPGGKGLPGAAAAGGQRGKNEEDEEHERKYVLDVDLFADDGTAVDPETGMRPTPPTLGA